MLLTFSSPKFDDLLRRLNDRPELTTDEIELKFRPLTDALWDYVRGFGVHYQGVTNMWKSTATIRFSLTGHNVDTVLQGVATMEPISVTVEQPDIGVLAGKHGRPIVSAFNDNWPAVAAELTNIELRDLSTRLDSIALRLLGTPRVVDPIEAEFGIGDPELDFRVWAAENGMRVPDQARRNREISEALADEERRRAIEKRFESDSNDTSWGWREI
jgi:hypothetical protein